MNPIEEILKAKYLTKFLKKHSNNFYFEQELLPLNSVNGPVYKLLKLTLENNNICAIIETPEKEDEKVILSYLGVHNITLIEGKIKTLENKFNKN